MARPITVSLRRLFPRASFVGCGDIRVTEATERSSECVEGSLFAVIRGTKVDGAQFVGEALAHGATALLVERPLPDAEVPQCVVPNVRIAYAELCSALAGVPSRRLRIAGVTGTNGKTTVTWLIRSLLRQAGRRTGVLGTVEYHDGVVGERSHLTTPDSNTLSRWLAAMARQKTTHAAIELSSHALEQGRAAGTLLDVAIVTNVTQDHFDYHGNFESYLNSKAKIFGLCRRGSLAVLNADDPGASRLRGRIPASQATVTFGLERPAEVAAVIHEESLAGTRFTLNLRGQHIEAFTTLIGRHNVANCLAAAAAAEHFGLTPEQIADGIAQFRRVPGRLERVDCGQAFDVFVDYAHTDDALRRCLQALRALTPGRVFCVFGAGGDRDRGKRPLLGQAATLADVMVVTSDNPRSEDPYQIIRDILAGLRGEARKPHVEADRAEAIRWALMHAGPGDCVLVAGKGHETEQIIGTQRLPFDDREVVRRLLASRPEPRLRAQRVHV